jgi:hypothetical protein
MLWTVRPFDWNIDLTTAPGTRQSQIMIETEAADRALC